MGMKNNFLIKISLIIFFWIFLIFYGNNYSFAYWLNWWNNNITQWNNNNNDNNNWIKNNKIQFNNDNWIQLNKNRIQQNNNFIQWKNDNWISDAIFVLNKRKYDLLYNKKIKEINQFLIDIKQLDQRIKEINDFLDNNEYTKNYLIKISDKLKSLTNKMQDTNQEYIKWINNFDWIVKTKRIQVIEYKIWWIIERNYKNIYYLNERKKL